jgi:hypothetical protein
MTVPAPAATGDDDELAPLRDVKTFKLHRYAFDSRGRTLGEMAALGCLGGEPGRLTAHHTKGDVAAALFTGGWYTPVHVTVDCTAAERQP